MAIFGHLWPLKWPYNGQTHNFGSEHSRNVILVSMPRLLGMGNPLGPFSDTSEWPKWPKSFGKMAISAIFGHSNGHAMAKLVTLVLGVLLTWFWCVSPGFGPWETHWDHFQTPQNDLSGQNGHFSHLWPLKWPCNGQTCNFGSEHPTNLILR